MNILLLFGVFFVLIMLSVPIGVALGVATSLTICLTSNIGPVMVAQKAFTGLLYADRHSLLHVGGQFDGSGRYRQTYRQSCRRRGG